MLINDTDRFVDDTAQSCVQVVLDAENFQACRSELKDFLAVTHNRLQSLSQSLSRRERLPASSTATGESMTQSEMTVSAPAGDDPVPEIVQKLEPPVERPTVQEAGSPATDGIDEDPMERLNAIKRRLADQMQNAC